MWNLKPRQCTFILCFLKIYRGLWLDLLPIHDFVTSCISHLKNIGSLNYANVANIDMFHYTISKKITFVNITTNLIRKIFKYGDDVKLTVVDTSFPKFQFSLESLNLSWAINTVNLFSLKWQGCCLNFRENVCQILLSEQPQFSCHGSFK